MARRKRPVLGAACPTSAQNCKAKDRQVDALSLRKQGLTYSAIAEKLGVSKASAVAYVQKALKELAEECKEEAEQVRDLELARLDDLYVVAAKRVAAGSEPAIDRCLRIMDRRARYLGLDAAEKVDVSGDIVIIDDIPRKSEGAPQK